MQKSLSITLAELYIIAFYRGIRKYNFPFNYIKSSVNNSENFLHWLGAIIAFLWRKLRDQTVY